MLKGVNKLNNIINDLFKKYDIDCKAELESDFSYYYNIDIITYALATSERMNDMFMNYAKSLGLAEEVDIFILSLMHEIGHYMTWDLLSDDEIDFSENIKENLFSTEDDDCMTYFNLPDEKIATEYAVNFINEHADELRKWWKNILLPAIHDFYELNGVTSE